ncbi:glutamyl-tRNA synthetase [Trichophyton equinum CBS 127.97]|uniref:Glutamyl-tRNA synthetase n=1 Tax=Trichophyton equinum (strain ATCC MYA-4606 / CBS 127.97) TaxID=559882 RepID=F2Q345_TRIEC|nr:glutamyl-tRNA synthetase [Trichophyton equinum CBS 127.97]
MKKGTPKFAVFALGENGQIRSALREIDDVHSKEPKAGQEQNWTPGEDEQIPDELHYANRMTEYLLQHDSNPSELLRLAVRAQHLQRWEVPRADYPMNRMGYLSWRTAQKKRQATHAEEICLSCGYSTEEAARVGALVRKEDMKRDAECQVLEDVACLVFLADQFEKFEQEHGEDREKIVNILRKTWAKMSERGHELALQIKMSDQAKGLVAEALET